MLIGLDESYREAATDVLAGHELQYFPGRATRRDDLAVRLRDAEILAIRWPLPFRVDEPLLRELPRLRFIQKSGTGVDGLDVPSITARGIVLSNNEGVNARCVAEHIMLLTLLCLRNASTFLTRMRQGVWDQTMPTAGVHQLAEKTVGIVGLGQIGSRVARRMAAFDTRILVSGPHPHPAAAILGGFEWVPLDDLLQQADVVVLCVPLAASTHQLIGRRELDLMQSSAVLINCSRGQVVDEAALYDALVTRRIRAAGLDVFPEEPTPPSHPLLVLDTVFATPHIAGRSEEMTKAQIDAALGEVARFAAGRQPQRIVNREVLSR